MRISSMIAILLVAMSGVVARADMESLHQFLKSAEETAQLTAALRADGEFEVASPSGTRHDQVVMLVRPVADSYIELHQEGTKALLTGSGDQAYLFKKGASKAQPFPPDATFADSDFTREDLEPFRMARYKDGRISDETGAEVTVTLFPSTSQYSLVVITFDREKQVPVKILCYKDTLNNLVKMRRDDGHVLVGRKWMPTSITMETFKLRTHTSFKLKWSQNPTFPPELFDPVFLPRPSGIVWPVAAAGTPGS
jgi:Outer membrane lipoprotein-sorting protein